MDRMKVDLLEYCLVGRMELSLEWKKEWMKADLRGLKTVAQLGKRKVEKMVEMWDKKKVGLKVAWLVNSLAGMTGKKRVEQKEQNLDDQKAVM